jgi:hypothetical protein
MVWGYLDKGGRRYFCYAPGKEVCKGFTEYKGDMTIDDFHIRGIEVGTVRLNQDGSISFLTPNSLGVLEESKIDQKDLEALRAITGGLLCSVTLKLLCLQDPNSEMAQKVETAADIVQYAFIVKSLLKAGLSLAAVASVLKKGPGEVAKLLKNMSVQELNGILKVQKNEVKALLGNGEKGAEEALKILESGKIPQGAETITRETLLAYREIALRTINNPAKGATSIGRQQLRLQIIDKMLEMVQ